jgi:hypothetical protein
MELKPITLLNAVWGSRQSLLNQDLDNMAPRRVIDILVQAIGVAPQIVVGTTLSDLDGRLTASYNACGRKTWILPTTIKSNDRRRPGLQFCPACLATDRRPYFRRTWRLAFVTACIHHGNVLHDCCPACGETLQPHRSPALNFCFRCGADLCEAPLMSAEVGELAQQFELETILSRGWALVPGEPLYSHLYFAIFRQIAALLVNGPRAEAFREATARLFGGDASGYDKPTPRQPIEYLRLDERRRLFDLVARLIAGFPIRFVAACEKAGILRSHAIKDMPHPPFIYERAMRTYLDRTPYQASEAEVAAAARWLRKTIGHASYADLKALCGESRVALYRHMDYLRRQSRPSCYASRLETNITALQIAHPRSGRADPHSLPAPSESPAGATAPSPGTDRLLRCAKYRRAARRPPVPDDSRQERSHRHRST